MGYKIDLSYNQEYRQFFICHELKIRDAVCGTEIVETVRYNVKIDVCPGCKGVWLDRDESEKIVERARRDVKELIAIPAYKVRRRKRSRYFLKYLVDFSVVLLVQR